jgi:polyhydroxybutyrate depolymerase
MVMLSGFNDLAEEHKFAVVYPAGTGSNSNRLYWNILLSQTYATAEKVDDLGFLGKMLERAGEEIQIDTQRVYAAGFSQGGMMCYRMACDPSWSEKLAGMAVVGATMTVPAEDCNPSRNVPLFSVHGMQDPFNNFGGGIAAKASRYDRVARPGVYETIDFWIERGGLDQDPDSTESRGVAACRRFGPGADGYEVISWEIMDGGHTWPGSGSNLPEWMVGRANRDINGSGLIWSFLSRYKLP